MVAHPRAPLGTHTLRALNVPVRLVVRADAAGQPLTVHRAGWPGPRAVACIQDRWRIDDEWWRDHPISRLYFTLHLDSDTLLTVYHDLIADAWFEQRG
jgi:hypothetical protein